MYTYEDLLRETEAKKRKFWADIAKAMKGPADFLVKAEIERNPGQLAYTVLIREFCEKIGEHIGDWCCDESGFKNDDMEAREIGAIYMAYEDSDPDLYEMLPYEARLFDID